MERRIFSFLLLFLLFLYSSCIEKKTSADLLAEQQIERRDSLYIVYTVKELHNKDWYDFRDIVKMYKMKEDQFQIFISRVFYSPDKRKIIVWYGERMSNVAPVGNYYKNKICPIGGDTVYYMSALIGFREDTNKVWQLYPLRNQSVECSNSVQKAIVIMEAYYFDKMKDHTMWHVLQNGDKKGTFVSEPYGYNIQDKDFWEKCWIWEKDTVGSNGLYPFQEKSFNNNNAETCIKCAEAFKLPEINYPDSIINMYKK